MESIGSTIWFLAFLVQYGALVATVVSMVVIIASTVIEFVRNKAGAIDAPSSAPAQTAVEGSAA
jgi:hypothetical protein